MCAWVLNLCVIGISKKPSLANLKWPTRPSGIVGHYFVLCAPDGRTYGRRQGHHHKKLRPPMTVGPGGSIQDRCHQWSLGLAHSLASSEHCCHFVLLCSILKRGDGRTDYLCGLAEWIKKFNCFPLMDDFLVITFFLTIIWGVHPKRNERL